MFKRFLRLLVASVALMVCGGLLQSYAADNPKTGGLEKTTTNAVYRWFTINNCFNWYNNNGRGSYNKITSNSGFEIPKGSGKQAIFEDGIVWGGFHKGRGDPKVGGSTYNQGLQAGRIVTPGGPLEAERAVADDPLLAKYRVYRVRPDIKPGTALSAVQGVLDEESSLISRYESFSAQALYNLYIQDWNEWPANEGPAPYTDVNHNGTYEPSVDIPGQPGADQTLYYVANDLNAANVAGLSGSPPIGLEMHRVVWGYNLTGALGSTIFESTLIINKSGSSLDSAFFVQWSDPDLGTAEDDYAGCDVPRSLGYVYNGKPVDGKYGTGVPAVGYDFFQGPILAATSSDSAVFQLKYRHGFKNLGMTTFVFFINGNATYTDPNLGAGGDIEWYRLMNGRVTSSDAPFINPQTGLATKFALDGDPVTGQGWLDGTYGFVPGDRRLCLITGPFTLANGDTQELVVAKLAGFGADRISSVNVLKWYDDLAQSAYNNLFNIPRPPPTPKVQIGILNNGVALSWTDSVGSVNIESWDNLGYAFEGYNVYQFKGPSAVLGQAIRLTTYDKVNSVTTIFDNVYDQSTGYVISKPVQFGSDVGMKRFYQTTTDAVNSRRLVNGSPYYFGVSSYSYNPSLTAKPAQLESAPDLLTVVPQEPNAGARVNASVSQVVPWTHPVGVSTAIPEVTVVDPTRILPKTYEIRIAVTDSVFNNDLGFMVANPKWQVFDVAANLAMTPPSTDFNFSTAEAVVNGVQVGLEGAPFYVAGKELGSLTWEPEGHFNFTGINDTPYPADGFINSILSPFQVAQDVQMEFTATGQGQNAYMFLRTATGGSGGAPLDGYYPQPFKVYELNPDGTRKRQIDFAFMEQVTSPTYDKIWAPGASSGNREYWFFITETYSPTAKAKYTAAITLNDAMVQDSVVWSGWYQLTNATTPAYVVGDVWTIKTTKVVTAQDRWAFSTVNLAPTAGNVDLAKTDVDKVNVFPNPYIGYSTLEANKYERFLTFSHLPANATIRIFNLAGVLVKTLVKQGGDSFYKWNLRNEQGFPVASGMYIAYVDMPDQGKTKTLKLGVVMEQQFIDRW